MKTEHLLLHRLYSNHLIALIPNFYIGAYECDIFTLNKNFYTTEYEIKRTVADFKKDFNKNNNQYVWKDKCRNTTEKHELISCGRRTNRFYFVLPEKLLGLVEIPKYAGLLSFDPNKAWGYFTTLKKAPRLHSNPIDQERILHIVKIFNSRHYSFVHQKMSEEDAKVNR